MANDFQEKLEANLRFFESQVEVFYRTVHPRLTRRDKHGIDTEMEPQPDDTAEVSWMYQFTDKK